MDERNPASQLSEGKKEGGEEDSRSSNPRPPPTYRSTLRSLAQRSSAWHTYRSTPPLWFHSPRERESSAMVPTVPFHPFFFYEREKRSSAWNPSLPPSLFHRSSAWDLPFNPPERVIGQVPYRSTSFFYERERGHQPGPTVQPPLSGLVTQRERESSAMVPTVRPLAKRPPPTDKKGTPSFFFFFFFFLPAQKHVDPFTNKGCLCREKPEGSNPRVPTIRLQGRGKGSGGTAPCLRARTTQLPRKKDALRGNTRHSRHRPPKPLHVNIITSLVSAPVAHNDQCKRGLTPRAAPVYRNNALGTMKRLPSVQSPTPLKD
jgi:hypothetical protein